MITLICKHCFGHFEARRSSAKYCSNSCRQTDYRIRHGQRTDKRFSDDLQLPKNERHHCKNCGKSFFSKGKGRTPLFCSNSCRVSSNRYKRAAAFKFVKSMNGAALGWSDYDCFMHVEQSGTDAIEKWAIAAGWEYSYTTHRFWKRSAEMRFDYVTE